jgi:hypothetical protein
MHAPIVPGAEYPPFPTLRIALRTRPAQLSTPAKKADRGTNCESARSSFAFEIYQNFFGT